MPAVTSVLHALKERLYQRAFNRFFLDAFAMTEDNLGDYVDNLQRYRPKIIVGYVAPLVILSRWMLEHGRRIDPPVAVITGAEALTTPDRDQLNKAFGAPVFNTYGCREFMLLASECEHRDGLHISADHLVLETVDAEGRPVTSSSGDVCVTDLHNYAMPFVRYLNGDRATYAERACQCGRGLPLLETVDGRILDIIVTRDGHMVPGEFFVHTMLEFPDIRQYQVVQVSPERLDIRIVPRTKLSTDERALLKSRFVRRMGTDIDIAICEVDSIPKTASGKRRITVSHIQ